MPKVAVMWQSEPLICAFVEHHSCSTSRWSPGASYTAVSVPRSPLSSFAFGHRQAPVPQALFTPLFCIGFSSLKTHWNLRRGNVLFFLNFLRRALASGSPSTFQNSAFLTMNGSLRRAAPIEEMKVISFGREVARRIRSALSFSESMASMMKSYSSMWNSSAVSA